MKVGLIGINSQFVHTNLALYYLREELPPGCDGVLLEYTNNEPILAIYYDLIRRGLDAAAFSVYIWNKETSLRLISLLKAACPDLVVIVGGPEPTYHPEAFAAADVILPGALEMSWPVLMARLAAGEPVGSVEISAAKPAASWKFPYRESDLPRLKNRLVYYETSRGCPYRCAFCLSSVEEGTFFLPLERVFGELDFFLKHRVPVVKLVDRTFNAPPKRAKAILRYLTEHAVDGVTFHLELKGELLDEETVALLTSAPDHLFQVEIGVQSLNENVLAAVGRRSDWAKVKPFYRRLAAAENLHTHFDLIAGLPGEDLASFQAGFDEVMSICPDYLQVGFLKLLPGTRLAAERERFGYAAEEFPPYEVVAGDAMTSADLADLKRLDHFMDEIYNKGRLRRTLAFALKSGVSPFELFLALEAVGSENFERVLEDRIPLTAGGWSSLLRLDALLAGGGETGAEEEKALNQWIRDEAFVAAHLPQYAGFPPREIYKRVRAAFLPVRLHFDGNGEITAVSPGETKLLFDYREKGRRKRKTRPTLIVPE
ncbi:MAG: DUF4080 domain-containing protein [Bacillota bacterium]